MNCYELAAAIFKGPDVYIQSDNDKGLHLYLFIYFFFLVTDSIWESGLKVKS